MEAPERLRRAQVVLETDLTHAVGATLGSFFLVWAFRHGFGLVTVNDFGIILVCFASPVEPATMQWAWPMIDEVSIETLALEGRAYDVLVARTNDGSSHAIGLGRRVNRGALLSWEEHAGLSPGPDEAGGRTCEQPIGSDFGRRAPG